MRTSGHLYLTGFRGTGKSSVGSRLATVLGMPLVDLDDEIEATTGKSIRQIFDAGGEHAFRDLESAALALACARPPSVISLGGGAILRAENRDRIATGGRCVWLDADVDELVRRLADDATTTARRPPLTALGQREEIRRLLDDRRPLYQAASDHRVGTTGKSIDEVTDEILRWLQRTVPADGSR